MTGQEASTGGRSRRLALYGLLLTWAAAFAATHLPPSGVPTGGLGDVYLHGLGYFVLTSIFLAVLAAYGARPARRIGVVLFVLAIYGAVDEATQPLVGRHMAFTDWLADVGGVVAAVLVVEVGRALLGRSRRAPRAGG